MRTAGLVAGSSEPTAVEWLARLRSGACSAREVAQHHLDRIAEVNVAVNAVVTVNPDDVLRQADIADARRKRGEDGALLGLPVTVKDSIEVAGLRSTGGSWGRREHVPERDATVVARMRTAGAVVLGKTNVPELCASYETDNGVFGRTGNPHSPARTCGGSSGGEAAAIAAGISPLGVGSDGGGSIRVPAHYCGIHGLRPTAGRVPETGQWPPSRATGNADMVSLGPLARSTADLVLLLEVISGPDLVDPYACPVPLRDHHEVDVSSLRVAVYVDDGVVEPTPGTVAAVRRVAGLLRQAGARVTEVRPPAIVAEATELFFAATGGAGGQDMLEQIRGAEGHHSRQFGRFLELMTASRPSAADWFAILDGLYACRSQVRCWAREYDVVLTPVVSGPAPLHEQPPHGVPVEEYFAYRAFNHTHTWSVAGMPALSLPAGTEDGLPLGVQVVANPWREDVALAVSAHVERELEARR